MSRLTSSRILALTIAVAGCGPDTGPASEIAQLRVMHVRAGAPAIDLVVEGTTVAEAIDFSRISSFADVPAGEAALEIRTAEAASGAGSVLGARTVELAGGQRYTLLYSNSGGTSEITLAADTAIGVPTTPPPSTPADTGAIPGENKIKLRVIHNAADAPPLDMYLTADGAPLEGASPSIEPFRFGQGLSAEFPGYFELDPGVYRVRLTNDGTKNVAMDTGPLAMQAGWVSSVIIFSSDTTGLGLAVVRER
jgi:hypothetical protein